MLQAFLVSNSSAQRNSPLQRLFSTKHPSFVEKRGEAVGMRKGKIVDKFVVAQLDVSGEKFYFVEI